MKTNFMLNTNQRSSSTSKNCNVKTLVNQRRLPDRILQESNIDENADTCKIFSILYGLIVFIGGVAFSISRAIIPREQGDNIKNLAAIYFTYLYWVSIIWIIFCIIDITHHKRSLHTHTTRINSVDSNHLETNIFRQSQHLEFSSTSYFNLRKFNNFNQKQKSYLFKPTRNNDKTNIEHDHNKSNSSDNLSIFMSRPVHILMRRQTLVPNRTNLLENDVHQQKHSIIQKDIGYNYDDHSTAGGLYIRVGIGIFCLGTVIHSGLSILSNLENLSCVRWAAVVDDFSRLLFSFIQFFFIFKHSNLIIRSHENIARLAVVHVVVTNLCVWFRMVVNETKSQMHEMSVYEMIIGQYNNVSINSNYSIIKNDRNLVNKFHCGQSIEDTRQITTFINEGYIKLKPLLYPCTIEFSLMCLTLFFLIWENIGKTFPYKMSDKASSKNVFMVNCHASIKGLFAGMVIFSYTVISIILYAIFQNKIGDDIEVISVSLNIPPTTTVSYRNRSLLTASIHSPFTSISKTPKKVLYSIAIVEIVNLCLLIISLLATIIALIKIRKFEYKRIITRFDNVLIIVSLSGIYSYSIFSAFALLNNKNPATWIAYVKIVIIILEFVEGTVHAFFILVSLRKRLVRTNLHEYPAREIITLLIILDLSLWFEGTATTTKHEINPFQLAFYHAVPWSIIDAISTPLQIFFRFHASVCLSHVWENMYALPTYEPIASHGL